MFFWKKKLTRKIFWLGLFLLVFSFFSWQNKNQTQFLQTPFFFLFQTPANWFSAAGGWLGEKIDFFTSIGRLKEENNRLIQENLSLKSQLAELKEANNENRQLRKDLDLYQKENFEAQAALVVARRLENGQAEFFIDKGTESGIFPGAVVLSGQKFLIGRVKKSFWKGAEIELIFNSNFLVGAEVQDQEAAGVVQGVRGTAVVLDKVSKSVEIEKGQTLISSGLGGEFPRGLLLGFVGDELEAESVLFRRFSVDFPVEIEKIRLVWVMK